MTIVTCTGYGNTGSSAITDYLSEFSNITILGPTIELQLLLEPGGFYELENALISGNQLLADTAIHRFLNLYRDFKKRFPHIITTEVDRLLDVFFKELNIVQWYGGWYGSMQEQPTYLQTLLQTMSAASFYAQLKKTAYLLYEPDTNPWQPTFYPACMQYYGYVTPKIFSNAAKHFWDGFFDLLCNANMQSDYFVVDHLFPPNENTRYNAYIGDIKTIVIDRDPVDLYLGNFFVWGERWIPTNDIDTYIDWYKQTRMHRKKEMVDSNKYLVVNFESMVFEYENISKKIKNFLSLDETTHIDKKKRFDPEKSIINTFFEKRFDCASGLNISANIERIKLELGEYCFDFSRYCKTVTVSPQKIYKPIAEIRYLSDNILTTGKPKFSLIPSTLLLQVKQNVKRYLKKACYDLRECRYTNLIFRIFYFPFYLIFQMFMVVPNSMLLLMQILNKL
jgi:hypothetical protein